MTIRVLSAMLSISVIFTACRRDRTNEFDVFDPDYISPPAGDAAVIGVYYDPYGYLVGVQVGMLFVEECPRSFSIEHIFYAADTPLDTMGMTITSGTGSYGIEIYSNGPWPIGSYSLRYYWGDIAVGACVFNVVDMDGRLVVEGFDSRRPRPVTGPSYRKDVDLTVGD